MADQPQYASQEKLTALNGELRVLKEETVPALAKRIDDARQMGDLSENAEYHAAREEMSWVQSRVKEIESILANAIVVPAAKHNGVADLSSTIIVQHGGKTRQYTIVGAHEADPAKGKISNESPLGRAFMGKKRGDKIEVTVPAGVQIYEIIDIK